MSYIDEADFTQESIIEKRSSLGKVDPAFIEKTIYAMELVGQLALMDLDFVFKGGTSLLLLDPSFGRLSIDVDIITETASKEFVTIFKQVIDNSPFIRWEEQIRGESQVPKSHYRFYFDSQINHQENYVLLDVLNTKSPYTRIEERDIAHPLFNVIKPVSVKLPSLDNITADKLAAFAPKTIGIPYGIGKSLQIIKQLFDLGELTLKNLQISKVITAYKAIIKEEMAYHSELLTEQDTLDDTIETAHLICQLDLKDSIDDEYTEEMRQGIRQIPGFIIQQKFTFQTAKIAASRVAFLASAIKRNRVNTNWGQNRYDQTRDESVTGVTLLEP